MNAKKAPSFETPGINYGSTQGDRPEDLNPRRQRCENLKRRNKFLQGQCSASPRVEGTASHASVFVKYITLNQAHPFSKIRQNTRHGNNIF